jgi:hypothetical protein
MPFVDRAFVHVRMTWIIILYFAEVLLEKPDASEVTVLYVLESM